MINVKSLRDEASSERLDRTDYVVAKDKKWSLAPLLIFAFLTGCVAYLKSFLPVALKAAPIPPPDQQVAHADDAEAPLDDTPLDKDGKDDDITNAIGEDRPYDLETEPSRFVPRLDLANFAPGGGSAPDLRLNTNGGRLGLETTDNFPNARDLGFQMPSQAGLPSGGGGGGGGDGGGGGGGGGSEPQPDRAGSNTNPPSGNSGSPTPPGGVGTTPVPPGGSGPVIPVDPNPVQNRAPRVNGPLSLQSLVGCHAYLITILSLLEGASDPDGDPLSLAQLTASSGTLTPTDGGWLFVPDQGMRGEVRLSYKISDGSAAIVQTASFSVIEAPPIVGTGGDDNLLGTHCADTVDGGDGDDNIDARGGNDVIAGGRGDDHIVGGAGNDVIYAGAGNDIVFAGLGNDIVFGGTGNDRLFGEDGDDILLGEEGDDLLVGGNGSDIQAGGSGNDVILGEAGHDTLDGDAGDDNIFGGDGNDVASGGTGNDTIAGDAGHDVLLGDAGHDTLDGGDGDDTISGGDGNDVVSGGAGNDSIADGRGADDVRGGSGDDTIVASADCDSDKFHGDEGVDTLDYSAAQSDLCIDVASGTAQGSDIGHDVFSGIEHIVGGSGDDHFEVGDDMITMTGGLGNDTYTFNIELDRHHGQTAWKITDFMVGDRLIIDSFRIYETDDNDDRRSDDDDFAQTYPQDGNSGDRQIRFRFESREDIEETFVDLLSASDLTVVNSVTLTGHHHLEYSPV